MCVTAVCVCVCVCVHPGQALNQEQWSDGEPTVAEKDFWDMAAMEAYSHLTEWKSLQYCSIINVDDSPEPDLDKMWAEPFYQVLS